MAENKWVVMLTRYRMENRLSMRNIAKKVYCQPATIWRWEKGFSDPNQYHTWHIKKLLGYL